MFQKRLSCLNFRYSTDLRRSCLVPTLHEQYLVSCIDEDLKEASLQSLNASSKYQLKFTSANSVGKFHRVIIPTNPLKTLKTLNEKREKPNEIVLHIEVLIK